MSTLNVITFDAKLSQELITQKFLSNLDKVHKRLSDSYLTIRKTSKNLYYINYKGNRTDIFFKSSNCTKDTTFFDKFTNVEYNPIFSLNDIKLLITTICIDELNVNKFANTVNDANIVTTNELIDIFDSDNIKSRRDILNKPHVLSNTKLDTLDASKEMLSKYNKKLTELTQNYNYDKRNLEDKINSLKFKIENVYN